VAGGTWLRQIEHKPWEIKVSGYPKYNDIRIGNSFFLRSKAIVAPKRASQSKNQPRGHFGGLQHRRCKLLRPSDAEQAQIEARSNAFADNSVLLWLGYPLLEIRRGLRQIPWPAKIAPVIGVGWKSNDSFSLPGEAHIGINDGKNALLAEHR
jgi:hypothetical protein